MTNDDFESAKEVNSTIVWVDEQNKLSVNVKPLCDLLLRPSIRNLPIALISVNGRMRTGKSFILNQMIKFLTSGESNPNWIDTRLETAFVWKEGLDRVTTGIQIYPEPFIVSGIDGDVAVILMDTQGIHDDGVGINETYKIFGLSALLSSLVIYNDKVHNADTFKTIYDFANFTTTFETDARDGVSEMEPVALGNLLMLFRDWPPNKNFPFGLYSNLGSAKKSSLIDYFLPKFPTSKNTEYRQVITRVFSDVAIYAMSGPGNRMPDIPEFRNSQTWEPEFKNGVTDFITEVLNPEFVSHSTKIIHGEKLTAKSFVTYVKKWAEEINKNDYNIKDLTSFESNIVAYFENKIKDSTICYQNEMIKNNVQLEKLDLEKVHFEIMGKINHNYWNACKFQNRKNEFYNLWNDTAIDVYNSHVEAQNNIHEAKLIAKMKIGVVISSVSFGASGGSLLTAACLETVAAPAVIDTLLACTSYFGLASVGCLSITLGFVGIPLCTLYMFKIRKKIQKEKTQ